MNIKAKVIADLLKGTLEGDPDIVVHDVAKIEEGKPGTLSFLSNPKYEKYIYETESSVVIVNKAFKPEKPLSTTLIRVDDAYESFADLLEFHEKSKPKKKGISPLSSIDESAQVGEDIYVGDFSVISPNARIGNGVRIYPQVFIGDDVTVGEGTILYPGVKIYPGCKVGRHCVLHAGVVIGADGFGFAPNQTNAYTKIPQLGTVIIEDHVEIGANTTIDRATMGVTVIRKGVKLDNLIMIGHNVDVGENSVIAGQTGISGSSKVGKNCMIAGQVGLIGHISIADEVKIAAQSGVSKAITEKGEVVQGSAAFNFSQYQKCYVIFKKLPELRKQILALEKAVSKLESGKS